MILAWLLHAFFATGIAYVLASIFNGLSPWIAIVSLLAGTSMGVRRARVFRRDAECNWRFTSFSSGFGGTLEMLLGVYALYVGFRHFMWMFFPMDQSWATLSANNFGDLPLHINYIRALANDLAFPPLNPIFAGEPLRYPFGPDLYNALWETLGVPLQGHLFIVGVFATIAAIVALRLFGSWWAIGAFFLSGGLAGSSALIGKPFADPTYGVDWKNLMTSVFITQRGMLFALPAGLWILKCVRDHLSTRSKLNRRKMVTLGLVWGLLPLFHLHSFVAVSLLIVGLAWVERGSRGIREILTSRMALVAYLPAIWFVLYSTAFLQKASVVYWQLGWVATKGQLLQFLVFNFGPWLLLPVAIVVGIWLMRAPTKTEDETGGDPSANGNGNVSADGNGNAKKKAKGAKARKQETAIEIEIEFDESKPYSRKSAWRELALYFGLFVLFFNFMMAPWAWDNVKLLIWPYLGFALLAREVLEPRLNEISKIGVAALLFFSGFVMVTWSIQSVSQRSVVIYDMGELASTEGAIEKVPKSAVFASGTSHQHPLTYFGRLRVAGYEGHLWSHGIDSAGARSKLDQLFAGAENWLDLMKSLGATHIFWGPLEREKYGESPRIWMDQLENVSRVKGYEVYTLPRGTNSVGGKK